MKLAFENRLNILLSQLLQRSGIISRAELLNKGRRDIVVYHRGLAIVLEGSYSRADAESDAKKRIEQLNTDVAIALHYAPIFPQQLSENEIKERLENAIFPVRVVVPEDISGTLFELLERKKVIARPVEDWYELDLNSLVGLIREVGQFIISEEDVKKAEEDVSDLIQSFVSFLSSHGESAVIARSVHDTLYRLYGFSIGEPSKIKEAIFAQASLAILLSSIYYESIRYAHALDSLKTLARAGGSQQALQTATYNILMINYEPIFEATRDMLGAFPPMPRLFDNLLDLGSEIASKRTLLRRDLVGKVYHKVVGDWALMKGLATFFTEIPAAYLLLYLAKPELSSIGDLACGSGTLLVAGYSATNTKYRLSLLKEGEDKDPMEIEREFHTKFISSCYGLDVLGYATQITALNLALHSPETPIKNLSSIYTIPLGYRKEDKSVSLGSLELARMTGEFDRIFREVTKTGVTERDKELMGKLLGLQPLDLIVMNPPFARATGRGGRTGGGLFGFMVDEEAREAVVRDYKHLRDDIKTALRTEARRLLQETELEFLLTDKDFEPYRAIGQAGEGLLFLYLADTRVRDDGKICFVLPKSLLTGVSWFLARAMLASRYHIEYIVVSFDAENGYNFSESTSLSECLLVAERVKEHTKTEETKFIILLRKPKTSIEAIALANSIEENGDYVDAGDAKAFIVKADREQMLQYLDNWGRFVFLPDLQLLQKIKKLLNGTIEIGSIQANIPLTKLNNLISSIGVDAHQFHDNFRIVQRLGDCVPGSVNVLYGGEEELRRKMNISPNAYAHPTGKGEDLFREKAGSLLVPDRIWIETAHVISMISNEPLLSNIFYAVRLKEQDEGKLKALCLWLNTTWGILTVLASREETRGGWIRLKMSQWRMVPVLNIEELPKDKIKRLATIFDEFKDRDLGRIPKQYGPKGKVSKLRLELDLSFLEAVGIQVDENDLLSLYQEIASSLGQWLGN